MPTGIYKRTKFHADKMAEGLKVAWKDPSNGLNSRKMPPQCVKGRAMSEGAKKKMSDTRLEMVSSGTKVCPVGSEVWCAVFDEDLVWDVRFGALNWVMRLGNKKAVDALLEYGYKIHPDTFRDMRSGKTWKQITKNYK